MDERFPNSYPNEWTYEVAEKVGEEDPMLAYRLWLSGAEQELEEAGLLDFPEEQSS